MDTIQCAVILAKLTRFEWEIARRIEIGQRYNRLFDERGIERVAQRGDRTSAFAQYTIFVDDRDAVQRRLADAGIPTAVHYPAPVSAQPAYQGRCVHGPLPHATQLSRRVLSVPMHADLDEELQDRIVNAVTAAVAVR
jgi:UDP-2-acetamido-2-deoxy-ribo-hexuluronate aminotransferase